MNRLIKISLLCILCFMGTICFATSWSMWEWKNGDATDAIKRKELLGFCKEQKIERIFLQLDYDWSSTKDGVITCNLFHSKEIHQFLGEANKMGIKVDALDGAGKFALKEWHPFVLSQLDAILAFNKEGKPGEQYNGVHYDIEPYGMKGFQDNRVSICQQYLDLVSALEDKIKQSHQKFILGLAIPMWYNTNRDDNGNLLYNITWNNSTKTMDQHILDLVDEIAIMDYRTKALGNNGAIYHAQGEIKYADSVHKKVWIGLETSEVHGDPPSISFFGHPKSDFDKVAGEVINAFKNDSSFEGIAIHHYGSFKKLVQNK
jgi:hypothetical protein